MSNKLKKKNRIDMKDIRNPSSREEQRMIMLAGSGDVGAMHDLARYYMVGDLFRAPNYELGLKWCMNAAKKGLAEAAYNVGVIYDQGLGVPVDYKTSAIWYEKAAVKKYGNAIYSLGNLYHTGLLGEDKNNTASYWYQKGCEINHGLCMNAMGVFYEEGTQVPQNYAKAYDLFEKCLDDLSISSIAKNNKRRLEQKMERIYFPEMQFADVNEYVGYVLNFIIDQIDQPTNKSVKNECIVELRAIVRDPALYESAQYVLNAMSGKEMTSIPNDMYNETERCIIKTVMEMMIADQLWNNEKYETIDYKAEKVFLKFLLKAIVDKHSNHQDVIENRRIRHIKLFVGYDDEFLGYEVIFKDCDSLYDMKEENPIIFQWNSQDELYNAFSIAQNKYKHFEKSSLHALATAKMMEEFFHEREDGRQLVNVSAIIMNYTMAFELELKKIVSMVYDKNSNFMNLKEAIDLLVTSDLHDGYFGTVQDDLHRVRQIRNAACHGQGCTYDDLEEVKKLLMNQQILKHLSWTLCDLFS